MVRLLKVRANSSINFSRAPSVCVMELGRERGVDSRASVASSRAAQRITITINPLDSSTAERLVADTTTPGVITHIVEGHPGNGHEFGLLTVRAQP